MMLERIKKDKVDIVIGYRLLRIKVSVFFHARRIGITFFEKLIRYWLEREESRIVSGLRVVNKSVIELFAGTIPSDYPEPRNYSFPY